MWSDIFRTGSGNGASSKNIQLLLNAINFPDDLAKNSFSDRRAICSNSLFQNVCNCLTDWSRHCTVNDRCEFLDYLATRYEGNKTSGSEKTSQSGTMKFSMFFDMIIDMVDGGVLEIGQDWVDCGCGAGIILFYLMIIHHLFGTKGHKFYGFDMIERQVQRCNQLITALKSCHKVHFEFKCIQGTLPTDATQL